MITSRMKKNYCFSYCEILTEVNVYILYHQRSPKKVSCYTQIDVKMNLSNFKLLCVDNERNICHEKLKLLLCGKSISVRGGGGGGAAAPPVGKKIVLFGKNDVPFGERHRKKYFII